MWIAAAREGKLDARADVVLPMHLRAPILALTLALALGGCGDGEGDDDAGRDAGGAIDGGAEDAGATTDAGAALDGGSDAGSDAGAGDGGDGCPMGCVPPDHAIRDCSTGACDFRCDPGWVRRGDGCIEELACTPGLVGMPVRVTDDGNRNNTPTVAVSGSVAAVFWIRGGIGANTRSVYARFYDYPAFTPRTDVQVVASGSLDKTSRIEIVPVSAGFAVLYDRVDHTFGTSRCALDLYDGDGVRTPGSFSATGGSCRGHAMSGSDAGFAMAWGFNRVDARRFDAMGRPVAGTATTRISDSGRGGVSHIAWHPTRGDYRIAYTLAGSVAGTVDVLTATLSTTGFRTSVDVPVVTGLDEASSPELVAAGPGYGLLFRGRMTDTDPRERWLLALDSDGALGGAPTMIGRATRAALAAGPHELGVVLGAGGDLEVRVYDLGAAPVGGAIPVASGPSDAEWPDIAWAGDGFVVAWTDDVAGAGLDDIYVARVCPMR